MVIVASNPLADRGGVDWDGYVVGLAIGGASGSVGSGVGFGRKKGQSTLLGGKRDILFCYT